LQEGTIPLGLAVGAEQDREVLLRGAALVFGLCNPVASSQQPDSTHLI